PNCKYLRCLIVGDESFFYNPQTVFSAFDFNRHRVFLNVSGNTSSPKTCSTHQTAWLTGEINKLKEIMIDNAQQQQEHNGSKYSPSLVVDVNWRQTSLIPSISGWLLGYPVIYVLESEQQEKDGENKQLVGNCLSNCLLSVFTVFGSIKPEVRALL
ncbi:hypothetical protein HK100_008929, partial [Physocladia obscura]